MKILRYVFSIHNEGMYKIINICGIKVKLKNKIKILQAENQALRREFSDFIKTRGLYDFPIEKDKIVFVNYFGKPYGCNPKYIAEEILRQKLPYRLVWLVKDASANADKFPASVKVVEYNSLEAMKELITAKLWVSNVRFFEKYLKGLIKRPEQKYINTWHGSLGIKKIEAAIENESYEWRYFAKIDSNYIDLLLSDSLYDDKMFGNDFWYKGEIARTGHPRCDIFFMPESEKHNLRTKVYKQIGIPENSKLVLYLPTFRDDGDYSCFNLDCNSVLGSFDKRFAGNWILGIRLHPATPGFVNSRFEYSDKIINLSTYPDNLELLAVADAVITDYSSCIFDFIFTKKPGFIYAEDLEKYNNSRGFYYSLEETPFPIAVTNENLISNILSFDAANYRAEVDSFLRKQDALENGTSSINTVEYIKRFMEE